MQVIGGSEKLLSHEAGKSYISKAIRNCGQLLDSIPEKKTNQIAKQTGLFPVLSPKSNCS